MKYLFLIICLIMIGCGMLGDDEVMVDNSTDLVDYEHYIDSSDYQILTAGQVTKIRQDIKDIREFISIALIVKINTKTANSTELRMKELYDKLKEK